MVPINPATQAGVYPSTGLGSSTFDPYAPRLQPLPRAPTALPGFGGSPTVPPASLGSPALAPGTGTFPAYNGAQPGLPGVGQSATVGTFPNLGPAYAQPGVLPNSTPAALFPAANPYANPSVSSGSLFGNWFRRLFGGSTGYAGGFGQPPGGVYPPGSPGAPSWNPQGTVFNGSLGSPQFLRLFQGPRFRHAYIHGSGDPNALMINDSDASVAFAIPNFMYSTQPLYLLPSFSLHQWDGPKPPSAADLPALAYSAFLDSSWQSDPARILGAELGLRVGMFSDFNTANSDSLRIMGRGIGRVRVTPKATVKLGVIYLDRNKIKLLPAGGLLWQPNPDTRFDLFFPEPKLAHYVSTVGTLDTWWYVGGYYGGGAWTVTRADTTEDSIDINDLRLVLGLEWGKNEQMRQGRRTGFIEVGYVFDRELLYSLSPADNLSLQDTIMVRAGIGY